MPFQSPNHASGVLFCTTLGRVQRHLVDFKTSSAGNNITWHEINDQKNDQKASTILKKQK